MVLYTICAVCFIAYTTAKSLSRYKLAQVLAYMAPWENCCSDSGRVTYHNIIHKVT